MGYPRTFNLRQYRKRTECRFLSKYKLWLQWEMAHAQRNPCQRHGCWPAALAHRGVRSLNSIALDVRLELWQTAMSAELVRRGVRLNNIALDVRVELRLTARSCLTEESQR